VGLSLWTILVWIVLGALSWLLGLRDWLVPVILASLIYFGGILFGVVKIARWRR
jgi:hypothetical protein